MAKTLVIVESPAKAKTISRFLGTRYLVRSSMGHIRDLPKSQFGIDVEAGFKPKYINIRGKGKLVQELRKAAKESQRVLLATDPDREGEAIAWHLQQVLEMQEDDDCRIEFHEVTKPAVQAAIKDPRPIDRYRVEAQQARRILDRVVGYKLSPLLWRKIRRGLSAGRVQSVALWLIVDREAEIRAFVSKEYWTVTAHLENSRGQALQAQLIKVPLASEEETGRVLAALDGAIFQVQKVESRTQRRTPPPPFITSTLQQEANTKLNFSSRRTMRVAQQLYEGLDLGSEYGTVGLITYLRTDSVRISAIAKEEAAGFIAERYGQEYLPKQPARFKARENVQDAHEAVRPTSVYREPEKIKDALTADQYKLYRLIWERFLASQMAPSIQEQTIVTIQAGDYLFRASGTVIKFPGFRLLYQPLERKQAEILPEVAEGEVLNLLRLEPQQHFTQPPPRYSEATLVKVLEQKGIGRPSTYAPIIETILERGYVIREQKQLVPTELGEVVVNLLKEHFSDIIDVEFTAQMEAQLDRVEAGDVRWQEVVNSFYWPFIEVLEKADREIGAIAVQEEVSEEKCEKCGRNMVVKQGRYGKFLACPGFPECRNTRPLQEKIGVVCPKCGGEIIWRRTKKGRPFYGCSNYPECNFISWQKPSQKDCPVCGTRMVEKQHELVCPNRECRYREAGPRAGEVSG